MFYFILYFIALQICWKNIITNEIIKRHNTKNYVLFVLWLVWGFFRLLKTSISSL